MPPSATAYFNAVQQFGSVDDQRISERHNVSLAHKFTVLDRLNESVSQVDLNHYVGWDTLHATNPVFEIPNGIFTFRIQNIGDFRFTIAFLVEAFLSYGVSVLDVLGKDIMHAHNLGKRGLHQNPNLRQIVDKHGLEFGGSALAKLWSIHYPSGVKTWVSTLKNLRNYYLHEDVCGSVIQMGVMIPTKPEILLDEEAFPSGIPVQQRALSYFCPTVTSQLSQLASDTYSLMESEIQTADRFPL